MKSISVVAACKVDNSAYLRSEFPKSIYIDLSDAKFLSFYNKEPSQFRKDILALPTEKLDYPIIIDKIEAVPALLDEIRWLTENTKATFLIRNKVA